MFNDIEMFYNANRHYGYINWQCSVEFERRRFLNNGIVEKRTIQQKINTNREAGKAFAQRMA